ncbi:ndufs8, ubiquinone oxidoreductase 23 kd subunit, partial [Coemansia sp. RSA 454]
MYQRMVLKRVAGALARPAPVFRGKLSGYAVQQYGSHAPTNVHEKRTPENVGFKIPYQTWMERDTTMPLIDYSAKMFMMTELARGFWTVLMKYFSEPYTLNYPNEKGPL